MQILNAYIQAPQTETARTIALTDANGAFRSEFLPDGLTQADMAELTWNAGIYKETRDSSSGALDRNMQNLSAYFLGPYILGQMGYYANHAFHSGNGYFTENSHSSSVIGGADGCTWFPIKRLTGYNTLKYTGKSLITAFNYNYVNVDVGAVVDGVFQAVSGTLQESVEGWTEFSVDISELPYVDYIGFYCDVGVPAYKNIYLEV